MIQTVRTTGAALLAAGVAALLLAACRPQDPMPPDTPPEPQATDLRDAAQDPLDKAEAVEDAIQDADARRREAIDEAEP